MRALPLPVRLVPKLRQRFALGLVGLALVAAPWGCDGGTPPPAEDDDDDSQPLLEYVDAGIPDRPEVVPDAGFDECFPIAPLPASALPRCTAATRDCVAACPDDQTGEACRNACWANDPTPPLDPAGANTGCDDCVFVQLLSCVHDNGCDQEVNAFLCCLFSGGGECPNEAQLMFGCGVNESPECFDLVGGQIGLCYAESDEPTEPVDGGP